MKKAKIICFGEILWDLLPTGKQPGGAPMNVVYHLNALGSNATIISKIGKDALGNEMKTFLKDKKISTHFIQEDKDLITGIVDVTLDEHGSPSYKIIENVAWDNIELTDELKETVAKADAFIFGSLVCRHPISKNTLFELLQIAKTKVFDVNLRKPFYNQQLITELMSAAQIVKMNEEELEIITSWFSGEKNMEKQMSFIQQKFDLKTLIVSQGSIGAYCLENNKICFQPSLKIEVCDTIGSGDAFLAGFISEKMRGKNPQDCLELACKTGAYVATKKGAMPEMVFS